MVLKKKININKTIFNLIIILLGLKLIFSYLLVDLGWWLRDLTSNYESYNIFRVPQKTSSKLEFLMLPSFAAYFLFNLKHLRKYYSIFAIFALFLGLNVITSILNSKGLLDSIELTLKLISPILFFIVLNIHLEKYDFDIQKLAKNIVKLCAVLCIIALIFFNPSSNRGLELYLPIYFESIHTHSYILISLFIMISFPLYLRKKHLTLILFLALSFLFLWKGYAIRTAVIFYLLYIIFVLFYIHDFFKYLWVKIIIYLPLIAVFAYFLFIRSSLDQFSSGRLTMYSEKIDQIKGFNILELMFGRGKGSDLMRTEVWAAVRKGAHSDLITYFVENGGIFLFFFIILLMWMFFFVRKTNLIIMSLLLGYLLSSTISNGIASRPLAGYLFFLSLVYIIYLRRSAIDDT